MAKIARKTKYSHNPDIRASQIERDFGITQELLKGRFRYDEANSEMPLVRIGTFRGFTAAPTAVAKYRKLNVQKQMVRLNRLVWIFHHGSISQDQVITHINDNPRNCLIDNLRLMRRGVASKQNIPVTGASPYRGVGWHQGTKAYHARININGSPTTIGYAQTEKEAAAMYDAACHLLFGRGTVPTNVGDGLLDADAEISLNASTALRLARLYGMGQLRFVMRNSGTINVVSSTITSTGE